MANPLIVMINGSPHGASEASNTSRLLRLAEKELLNRGADTILVQPTPLEHPTTIHYLDPNRVLAQIRAADGVVVATGTYWGQGGSTLQRFFEEATPTEGTDVWLGKPAAVIVSEYSSGGQVVLSNLLLTLSNFGCVIPPQGGMVYSRTGQAAKGLGEKWALDVWGLGDIGIICQKLVAYAAQRTAIDWGSSWSVIRDKDELAKTWIEEG